MTASANLTDANVRSATYYVAHTSAICLHCGLCSRLLALAMPQGHETWQVDTDPAFWQREKVHALIFYVADLPEAIHGRLQQFSRFYRLGFDPGANTTYWANHCEHCGTLFGDHELYCEPESAFLPSSESAAALIQLVHLPESFEAAAGGYVCDPEFLAHMRKG